MRATQICYTCVFRPFLGPVYALRLVPTFPWLPFATKLVRFATGPPRKPTVKVGENTPWDARKSKPHPTSTPTPGHLSVSANATANFCQVLSQDPPLSNSPRVRMSARGRRQGWREAGEVALFWRIDSAICRKNISVYYVGKFWFHTSGSSGTCGPVGAR